MNVLVANVHVPFVRGGAEQLADDLVATLTERGHRAELLQVPFSHNPVDSILDQIVAFRLLDLEGATPHNLDRVVALKFPAYLIEHHSVATWLCHQHRSAFDLWAMDRHGLVEHRDGAAIRAAIRDADRTSLARIDARYTISANVSRRLEEHTDLLSEPLPPPVAQPGRFRCEPGENFLYYPSRLNEMKRQLLAVEALRYCNADTRLVLSGDGPAAARKEIEAAIDAWELGGRVEILGHVDDQTKIDLYARCRGVVFVPLDEDYGYVTLEAMLSGKPVITCTDSGGPLDFVGDGHTGFVTEPTGEALGDAYQRLVANAAEMGAAGRDRYPDLVADWDEIVAKLLGDP